MCPKLFQIGPIPVYSFGLMVAIAFLVANYFFTKEVKRKGYSEELASTITIFAFFFGLLGSKLFSIFENFGDFLENPVGTFFSPSGLTFYGGLLLSIVAILIYLRAKNIPFLKIADAAAPSLIIAYGLGRLGCHFAGDGDYGLPSKLPWAMGYPKGTVPTLSAQNNELAAAFLKMYPGEPLPVDIAVHPTPVYEFIASIIIFTLLWKLRLQPKMAGWLFGIYLVLAGIERLLVEFIRLNPLYAGLSQAQWISIGMILVGSILAFLKNNKESQPGKVKLAV
ncbi:MAG TPA: prolipoprotein diacylglyceryl transferase [Patescibacteria group bacterium]|nr:prolipoprotein diacylglyceryl transferase [Patescibacteria group bacterium]